MTTKLNNFDYDVVENYYQKNILENNFWLFGANALETTTPTSVNTTTQEIDILEKTVFGAKLSPGDVTFMLTSIYWEQNVVYTAYDDNNILADKNFYIVVRPDIESGSYQIFKCIYNNNNSPSLTKPEFNSSINLLDGLYRLNDGYVWKYMTSVPYSLYKKFATKNYVPLIRNIQVEEIASNGLYSILVENPELNSGYEELNGSILRTSVSETSYRIFLQTVTTFQQISNTYVDRSIYIEKFQPSPIIGGRTFKILSSGTEGLNNYYVDIDFVNYAGFTITSGDVIKILPQIKITGDGTGAIAIPILDSFSKITNIEILNPGIGYTKAVAEVVNPRNFDTANANRIDIKCNLRPIISPAGGHGKNLFKELNSKHIGISKGITSLNLTKIPSTNKYSKIGLVKNPIFSSGFADSTFDNRLKITVNGIISDIMVGDQVMQMNPVTNETITGIIHEVDYINGILYIIEYDGPYRETFKAVETVNGNPVSLNLVVRNISRSINNEVSPINKQIQYSPYQSGTGSVLFITDFTPVNRTTDKIEQIKLVIDF